MVRSVEAYLHQRCIATRRGQADGWPPEEFDDAFANSSHVRPRGAHRDHNGDGANIAKAALRDRSHAEVQTRTATRAGLAYSNVQRVIQLPPGGRWPRRAVA
jgi:hypothetical protein